MDIIIDVIVITLAVAFVSVVSFALGRARGRDESKGQEEKREAHTRVESAKEAFYARNLWSYDGGEQEEYQE